MQAEFCLYIRAFSVIRAIFLLNIYFARGSPADGSTPQAAEDGGAGGWAKRKGQKQFFCPFGAHFQNSVGNIRHKSDMSCSLNGYGELSLMLCASTGDSARENLGSLGYALAKSCNVLIVDMLDLVCAELTDLLLLASLELLLLLSVHGIHLLSTAAVGSGTIPVPHRSACCLIFGVRSSVRTVSRPPSLQPRNCFRCYCWLRVPNCRGEAPRRSKHRLCAHRFRRPFCLRS